MIRTLSADIFNQIASDPIVRPWLGGSAPIDLTALLENPDNFAFLTDEQKGGYIYHKLMPGLYEAHTLSLPSGRGRQMLAARSESLREMFTKTDAIEIVTRVPIPNEAAAAWAKHAGFRETFRRAKAFDLMGEMVDVSYQSLSYGDWVLHDKENARTGRAFHGVIHEYTADDHGDDPVHDGWVGATVEGCNQGNADKALGLYNRWAVFAGYEPIRIVTLRPLVVDIRSCILQIDPDGLHVLHVRSPAPSATPEDVEDPGAPCLSQPSVPLAV